MPGGECRKNMRTRFEILNLVVVGKPNSSGRHNEQTQHKRKAKVIVEGERPRSTSLIIEALECALKSRNYNKGNGKE